VPRVTGFNHFSAAVSDMDGALRFWRDLLGLELLGRGVVEYDYLDQIVGLTGTSIEWAELALPGGGLVELSGISAPRAARWVAG
jgi:catechol 2,3-dioxygenase-like lactoylglutathione lyase family enzyme